MRYDTAAGCYIVSAKECQKLTTAEFKKAWARANGNEVQCLPYNEVPPSKVSITLTSKQCPYCGTRQHISAANCCNCGGPAL